MATKKNFGIIFDNGEIMVAVDFNTNVQYIAFANGGATVLVDANGKPLLYED